MLQNFIRMRGIAPVFRWLFATPRSVEPGACIRWWEARRIPVNLLIFLYGLPCLLIFLWAINGEGVLQPGEDAVEPFAVLLSPIAFNIFYTLGWIVELFMRAGGSVKWTPRLGPRLMMLGLGFSFCVISLPPTIWVGYRCLRGLGLVSPTPPQPDTTAPGADIHPPTPGLDAIFAEIVRTDWQTAGMWQPRTPAPPPQFIDMIRAAADFRRIDLNGDGDDLDERIICLNHSPGQKPINQTFYIVQKSSAGWSLIGQMEGEPEIAADAPRIGMKPLDATWCNGGFQYTTTRYTFEGGRYVPGASRHWIAE